MSGPDGHPNGGPRFRPEVHAGAPYRPGRSAAAGMLKLSSNELPSPPSAAALAGGADGLGGVERYPDPVSGALRQQLAEFHGRRPDEVCVGGGSVALLQEATTATCSDGHGAVFGLPSFEAYAQLVRLAGATAHVVTNRADASLDPEGFVEAANRPGVRLVLIANPNNPTGTAWRADELRTVLSGTPPDVVVVLDEAYHEFVIHPDVPDGVDLLADYPNLVVLRTFSKAWALAGLRVGYALAAAPVIAALDAVRLPFSVSSPAQAAALAALKDRATMEAAVAPVIAERARLLDGLRAAGWDLPDSQANFVWFGVAEGATELGERLEAAGVLARVFPGVGVRLTVGAASDTDRILATLGS